MKSLFFVVAHYGRNTFIFLLPKYTGNFGYCVIRVVWVSELQLMIEEDSFDVNHVFV